MENVRSSVLGALYGGLGYQSLLLILTTFSVLMRHDFICWNDIVRHFRIWEFFVQRKMNLCNWQLVHYNNSLFSDKFVWYNIHTYLHSRHIAVGCTETPFISDVIVYYTIKQICTSLKQCENLNHWMGQQRFLLAAGRM